jgi:hypothetical protein
LRLLFVALGVVTLLTSLDATIAATALPPRSVVCSTARLLGGPGLRFAGLEPDQLRKRPDAAKRGYAEAYLDASRPLRIALAALFLFAQTVSLLPPDHRLSETREPLEVHP